MNRDSILGPPRPSREHGAWALLFVPLVVGLAGAGLASLAAWLVAAAVVLAFLARDPAVGWAERKRHGRRTPAEWFRKRVAWGGIYISAAVAMFVWAWIAAPERARDDLAAIAAIAGGAVAVHAVAAALGAGRNAVFELVGMGGAALAAPTVMVAGGASLDADTLSHAVPPFAYFASSLSWVRAYRALGTDRTRAVVSCLAAHVLFTISLVFARVVGALSMLQLLAFAPALGRTLAGLARPPRNLKGVGMREVWIAGLTALVAAIAAASSAP